MIKKINIKLNNYQKQYKDKNNKIRKQLIEYNN